MSGLRHEAVLELDLKGVARSEKKIVQVKAKSGSEKGLSLDLKAGLSGKCAPFAESSWNCSKSNRNDGVGQTMAYVAN